MDRSSPERRARLNAVKLTALVRDAAEPGSAEPVPSVFPGGAALRVGDDAWVLLDESPARGLGGAVAWAHRHGVHTLHVVADTDTGLLARRAERFTSAIRVWHADGRSLLPAVPEPLPSSVPPRRDHLALVPLIEAGGAVARVEHAVVAGEVDGLEVCRVVTDGVTGEARLEVGVGAHDREAFGMLHGAVPTVDALAGVVDAVRRHRRPGADPHPLNRLAAERSLRERALHEPHRIGARELAVAEPPVPRPNVKDPVPCVALGRTVRGDSMVAVFSTGVDLDAVPFAADALAHHARPDDVDTSLVLVVPERDRLPVTVLLAGLLVRPAEVVAWPA